MKARQLLLMMSFVLASAAPALARQAPEPPPAEPEPARASSSRLIFGPTARMPPVGGGHLAGYQLYGLPVIQVGLTPRVALSFGAPTASLICLCQALLLVAPKVQVASRGRTMVATGVIHGWAPGHGQGGYGYVVTTYGSKDSAITVGGGLTYGSADLSKTLLSLGAERRIHPRVVWVTENYIYRNNVLTSGGFRVHGTHWTTDLVLAWLISDGKVVPLPVLNITRSF